MSNFKFGEYTKESADPRYEFRNDEGTWIECVGGLEHAKGLAERDGTGYRVIYTTREAYSYEVTA